MDHVVPLAEDATLAYEPLNCRVLCNPCNAARRNHCTDAERQAVTEAIAARRTRNLS